MAAGANSNIFETLSSLASPPSSRPTSPPPSNTYTHRTASPSPSYPCRTDSPSSSNASQSFRTIRSRHTMFPSTWKCVAASLTQLATCGFIYAEENKD
ncbi:uncharacterized protein BDR25DRAFT_56464 [Lindgomyces ingoldianus]|uniref:Uncharacterized protein n=1 Tax=Lindgomyces ingoldianus TaxID=673940 RepID=A0ACB6QMX9_9PLEO|nr:uncharacterized protein BDR25DRAFT_56464 [Lindgomyces ingoldianus]KAF2468303.1 hypothetical protein BDR25DRAFT_56464 [Lindgomyces ingoldianus]